VTLHGKKRRDRRIRSACCMTRICGRARSVAKETPSFDHVSDHDGADDDERKEDSRGGFSVGRTRLGTEEDEVVLDMSEGVPG